MARKVNGTSTYIKAARTICRVYGRFGSADLPSETTAGFAAAIVALVAACQAFEALDKYAGEIDDVKGSGIGPEDPGLT